MAGSRGQAPTQALTPDGPIDTYDADPGIYGQHLITGDTYTVTTDDVIDLEMLDGTVVWMTQSQVRTGDLEGGEPVTIAELS